MADASRTGHLVPFVVQKDILNRPVRELDRRRHRDMWLTVGAVAVLVAAVLVTVWQEAEVRRLAVDVQRLQKELTAEEAASYHLRVELETKRSLQRIEEIATQQLNLVEPANGKAVVIERVRQPGQPSKGLVARRLP